MNEAILLTIRNALGFVEEYDIAFDYELIMYINAVLNTLTQLGVGPSEGFRITGYDETWLDFLVDDRVDLEMIKSYMSIKVKLLFDSSTMNSYVITQMESMAKELEWRINIQVDPDHYVSA